MAWSQSEWVGVVGVGWSGLGGSEWVGVGRSGLQWVAVGCSENLILRLGRSGIHLFCVSWLIIAQLRVGLETHSFETGLTKPSKLSGLEWVGLGRSGLEWAVARILILRLGEERNPPLLCFLAYNSPTESWLGNPHL